MREASIEERSRLERNIDLREEQWLGTGILKALYLGPCTVYITHPGLILSGLPRGKLDGYKKRGIGH